MTWTAPLTWTAGQVPTAAQFNAQIRDNFLETAPAKASGSALGSYFVTTGSNQIGPRTVASNLVDVVATTTSTTFGNVLNGGVTSSGPEVQGLTSAGFVLVGFNSYIANNTSNGMSFMSYDIHIGGVVQVAATEERAMRVSNGGTTMQASCVIPQTGVTGTYSYIAKYKVINASTATFDARYIWVLPF